MPYSQLDNIFERDFQQAIPSHIINENPEFIDFMKVFFDFLLLSKVTYNKINAGSEELQVGDYLVRFGVDSELNSFREESDDTIVAKVKYVDSDTSTLYLEYYSTEFFEADDKFALSRIGQSGFRGLFIGEVTSVRNGVGAIQNKLLALTDLDSSIDEFLVQFQKQFAKNVPVNALSNKRHLYKFLKEFYEAKGSDASYKFLFNILYDKYPYIKYPEDSLFKPSDNVWNRYRVIRVNQYINESFSGKTITGESSGATATVEKDYGYKLNQVFLKDILITFDSIRGEFLPNEHIVTSDGVRAKIVGVLSSIEITNPGSGYAVDDTILITPDSTGGSDAAATVTDVTDGRITSIDIDTAGTGYAVNDVIVFDNTGVQRTSPSGYFETAQAVVTSVGGSGEITGIEMYDTGRGYIGLPSLSVTSSGGAGAVLTAVGDSIGGIKEITISNHGYNYKKDPTAEITGNSTATLTARAKALFETTGEFDSGAKSFPSDVIYIQDSYYWQNFSYVVRVDLSINKWRDVVKRLIHPAGTIFFSEYYVNSSFPNELKKKYIHIDLVDTNAVRIYFANNNFDTQSDEVIFQDVGNTFTLTITSLDLNTDVTVDGIGVSKINLSNDIGTNTTTDSLYTPSP